MNITDLDEDIQNLNNVLQNLKKYKKDLQKQQSYYDTLTSEYYHLFENFRFPCYISAKLHKEFVEDCLHQRRIIKELQGKITSINNILQTNGLSSQISTEICGNKVFKPKILKDKYKELEKYRYKNIDN